MSKAVAILHGPNYWATNHDFDTIELHESVQAAADSLLDRYMSNGRRQCAVTYIDGHSETVFFPTMEGCWLEVWTPYYNEDPAIFAQEAHTLIHNTNRPDFWVTLTEHGTLASRTRPEKLEAAR